MHVPDDLVFNRLVAHHLRPVTAGLFASSALILGFRW